MEVLLGIGGAVSAIIGWGIWQHRQYSKVRQIWLALKEGAIFASPPWSGLRVQLVSPGMTQGWQRALLILTDKRIAVYPDKPAEQPLPLWAADIADLQGFWRPEPYHNGKNEMWIHVHNKGWVILKIQVYRGLMQELVRALKQIAPAEQIKAYRRQRPYIHLGPDYAQPARQSLQGDWQLDEPVELYLMPAALVVIGRDGMVQAVYPLAQIQSIAALRRMEGGQLPGLVRFRYQGEPAAFALHDYEGWAASLAEAAKRTLEEPVTRKSKSKDPDEDL